MVMPRKPKQLQRVLKGAKSDKAESDLHEFHSLVAEEQAIDPSARLSTAQQKKKLARDRRLKALSRRLFNKAW